MKKLFLLGAAALFTVALAASCSEDENEKCTTCTDGEVEYEVCWEEGKVLDFTAEMLEFTTDHPYAYCDEVIDY